MPLRAYLKQIPVDFVKIDGSFISMMTKSRVDFEMLRFTDEISHVMGRQTIAEYVDDSATLRELENIGVDFAQGFLLGEPRPLDIAFASMPGPLERQYGAAGPPCF